MWLPSRKPALVGMTYLLRPAGLEAFLGGSSTRRPKATRTGPAAACRARTVAAAAAEAAVARPATRGGEAGDAEGLRARTGLPVRPLLGLLGLPLGLLGPVMQIENGCVLRKRAGCCQVVNVEARTLRRTSWRSDPAC